jgi:hypothetical protein
MVDRAYLRTVPGITADQQDEVVLNGVRGIGLLGATGFGEALTALAERDPSPRVRAAADEARQRLKSAGA